MPGCIPSFTNGAPRRAEVAAYRMSQASARQSPAPIAAPLTAAIVGTSSDRIASQAR